MRASWLTTAVASLTVLGVAAAPAAAQQPQSTTPRTARVVATYDFGGKHRAIAFPSIVTVSDSAGMLVASASIPGDRQEIPMVVTVLDSDLVLQGETSEGVLTMVLDRQNEGGKAHMTTGRWALGKSEGQLRGTSRE